MINGLVTESINTNLQYELTANVLYAGLWLHNTGESPAWIIWQSHSADRSPQWHVLLLENKVTKLSVNQNFQDHVIIMSLSSDQNCCRRAIMNTEPVNTRTHHHSAHSLQMSSFPYLGATNEVRGPNNIQWQHQSTFNSCAMINTWHVDMYSPLKQNNQINLTERPRDINWSIWPWPA